MIPMHRSALALPLVLTLMAFFGWPEAAWATTTTRIDLACPVCVATFTAPQMMSSNTFGGQDTDFMTRARGTQPLLIAPVVCLKCGYAGYIDEFARPGTPDQPPPPLPDALKKAILEEKRLTPLQPLPASGSYEEIPVWVRYDLIAQVYALKGADTRSVARQYQNAAWVFRHQPDVYLHLLDEEQKAAMKKALDAAFSGRNAEIKEKHGGNQATFEVEVAEGLLAAAKAEGATPELGPRLGAFLLLRLHGENASARVALDLAKPLLKPEQAADLEEHFTQDLTREREFQAKAAEGLAKAAETAAHPGEKAAMRYHAGELYRRLEQYDKARPLFDQARNDPNLPDFLKRFLAFAEQRMPNP